MTADQDRAFQDACELVGRSDELVRIVLSGKRKSFEPPFVRVDLRPVSIKNRTFLQIAANDGRQTITENVDPASFNFMEHLQKGYANILVEHKTGALSIRFTKKDRVQVARTTGENQLNLSHDRTKVRLLDPADPFLKEVGISDKSGQIKPSRQDKYRQVEEFLRILTPTLRNAIQSEHLAAPTESKPLSIVDLGCGNAYLTFAAHQYLRSSKMPVQIVGIDVRADSRKRNSQIAERLEIAESIEFRAEEISTTSLEKADVVLALHACDTATDDAITWGILHGAGLMFIAPCCHHDLQSRIEEIPEPWPLLTRHGLLKERLGDLVTDALRAQILKIMGYRSEVIEFVGGEHTPRNLMIRAVHTGAKPDQIDVERYLELVAQWGVEPALALRLAERFENALKNNNKNIYL